MKTVDCKDQHPVASPKNESEKVTDLLIDKNEGGHDIIKCNGDVAKSFNVLKNLAPMGHKGYYQRILLKNNVTQDSRSQSMPNCLIAEKNKLQAKEETDADFCDYKNELLPVSEGSPTPSSPSSPQWFRTWPERCDKIKNNESSPEDDSQNTQPAIQNCDIVANGNVKCKLTLNEALQNISLAYSPVTKQLHLVEIPPNKALSNSPESSKSLLEEPTINKKGHKRNQTGSFSSTISSLSDQSPSGSLLDADERSLASTDDCPTRKASLTNFFSRGVFSWKSASTTSTSSSVWKLFSKSVKEDQSPQHVVASSSALIQHQRPSNLPAKTQEEEQRHREEYKAMVEAAKKKEAQNTAAKQKLQKLQLQQEEHQATATKHFSKYVLSNWDAMHATRKTRDLWWRGLPSSVRGKVWRLAIGNELNVTPQLYEICLNRAQTRLNSPEPSHCESDFDQESSMDVIQLDISRTFPHLCIFQEGGPYSDILHSLLAAYVCYRPDVGYVQGMSYIAAILILNMEAFDAFICFANLLNQPLHLSAFTLNQDQMNAYYDAYNEVFSYNLPKLYAHFEAAKLTPDLYLLDWIYTVFAKAMPLDMACRVWDIFLRDGYEFIFRTALGILHLNQDALLEMDFLHGAQFLTRLPDDVPSDQLFKSIQAVTTSIGKQTFCQIVDKYTLSFR